MLIVIGSDGNTLGSQVSKRFGRASYYIVYDTERKPVEAIKNDHKDESEYESEEEEHAILRQFLDRGVKAFIVGNIGPYAFQTIKTRETKVYLAKKMTVAEAVGKLISNELTELTEPTAKRSIGHAESRNKHE